VQSTTTRAEFRALAAEHRVVPVTRKVLADSETPLSAYRKLADNRPGTFQRHHLVYKRAGEPCTTCREQITYIRVSGRGTHLCPACQKSPSDRVRSS